MTVRMLIVLAVSAGLVGLAPEPQPVPSQPARAVVTARNTPNLARPAETVELSVPDLRRALVFDDVRKIHVRDDQTKQDVLTQAVDLDDDGLFELLIFQSDLKPGENKTWTLTVGDVRIPARSEFRAYGRFVRERRDDYAWENDRIAFRMYGAALETWAQEPLTSSAVDIWVKRTRRLVINDWYMTDDYHRDTGEGADLYSAGRTRGCGGNGIWRDGKLFPSTNFRHSRTLASGPIRVIFELTYDSWDAGGQRLAEVKRVTLDAGQNLNRFESFYRVPSPRPLQQAAGIRNNAGSELNVRREAGVMRTWEPIAGDNGRLGCAVLADPREIVDVPQGDGSYLMVTSVPGGAPAVYWAGGAWDRSGDFATVADWDRYLDQFAARRRTPLIVTIGQ